jgi:hypothetical protein
VEKKERWCTPPGARSKTPARQLDDAPQGVGDSNVTMYSDAEFAAQDI